MMHKSSVVFLMYHELETPGRPICQNEPGYQRYVLQAADFAAQMELLNAQGWRGACVGDAIHSFSDKTVTITFDDGCETDLTSAAPILQRLGFGATFYITTGWSGKPGFLSDAQIRELSSSGFEIGCHSESHRYLTDLDDAGLRQEIVDPKIKLEQIIGKPVQHFSCPGGRFDQRVAQVARDAQYLTVSTSAIQANSAATDRFALGRVAILRHTPLSEFQDICQGRGLWRSRLGVQLRAAVKNTIGNTGYDKIRAAILGKPRSG